MKKKIMASIEARMTSSRLPGKVLMESLPGVSMLEYMINRVKKSNNIDDIIVATTINKEDDPIVELCKKLNGKVYNSFSHHRYKLHSCNNIFFTDKIRFNKRIPAKRDQCGLHKTHHN